MTVHVHNVINVYWDVNCRGGIDVDHAQCFGLLEFVPENGMVSTSYDFMRCICPCHDGFNPCTGERMS